MIKKIFSKNADYQKFEVLKTNRNKRYKYQEFFIEGVRNIKMAIENDWAISSFIFNGEIELSNWAKEIIKVIKTDLNYELTTSLMSELSSKEDSSEILAVVKMREDNLSKIKLTENPLIVLFDRPSNKGNLGTIIRSCDSFGVDGLIVTGHSVDIYDADVISATMGSFFSTQIVRLNNNETLFSYIDNIKHKFPNFQIIGTTAHKENLITDIDFTRPTLLLIGNETDGLNKTFKEYIDILATIPMNDKASATSFNVGCAATVFLYEAIKQRL